jgi:hypothetical protein
MESVVWAVLGKVAVYAGSSAVFAFALFRFLGRSWIENKFAQRLDSFRHEQAKELEQMRYKINALFDRVTRIHDKEFQVLPEAWGLLQEALARVNVLVSSFRQYPDFNRLTGDRFEEFLLISRFNESDRKALRDASDRSKFYNERIFWYDVDDVKKACREFHVCIQKNSIFLDADLKEQFKKIDDLMWDAISTREVGHQVQDHKMWMQASEKVKIGAEAIVRAIEELVQKRLRYKDAG